MEVSNVRDHVTHATISGNKAIDFGISDSPEFFHILSSTLYSDQPLAVVREVLCNAWDAHIEAGCANRPVEVTLTDEELIIRDFGHGIHDDNIGEIYGVYGGSTKKKNKLVTGGFGLGCKAPFAYTDHFEVISWHAGRRTIYNMSKSSAEVNGRPGIIPIASFPTKETGLQVRIQLKDRYDRHAFERLIHRIASNGEMSVKLNGEPLDVLPFSSMKHGFMVTRLPVTDIAHQILVRYGHVVYPIENHEAYATDYMAIRRFLDSLPDQFGAYSIIFQAKPNSISVTPSREALSMQEHTLKTLTDILNKFHQFLLKNFQTELTNVVQESIVNAWVRMEVGELFSTSKHVPGLTLRTISEDREEWAIMTDLPELAKAQVCKEYPKGLQFRFHDLLTRVNSLVVGGFGNTNLIRSYRSEMLRAWRKKRFNKPTNWFHRKVVGPLLTDLKAAGLSTSRLSVYLGSGMFPEAKRVKRGLLENALPFLRNVVILTHNRESVEYRPDRFPIMKHWLGNSWGTLCYTVPRSSKKITDQAREFFQARGVVLIDLTVYHPWETAPVPVQKEQAEPKKKKPKGLPILGSLLDGGIRMDYLVNFEDKGRDIQRTTTPEVVVKLPTGGDGRPLIEDFGYYGTQAICSLWPFDIAVCISSTQVEKAIKEGAVELTPWVVKKVCAEIKSNKRIRAAFAYDYHRLKNIDNYYYQGISNMLRMVMKHEDLRKTLGIGNKLNEYDRHYMNLWHHMTTSWADWQLKYYPEIIETKEIVKNIKLSPALTRLYERLKARRAVIDFIDTNDLSSTLSSDDAEPKPISDLAKKIALLILKG